MLDFLTLTMQRSAKHLYSILQDNIQTIFNINLLLCGYCESEVNWILYVKCLTREFFM